MKKIKVLDSGFVRLVDHMGDDNTIEQAARVSYQKGTRHVSDTTKLIRYLLENEHTSPFEMCEFLFHIKMPLFVRNQWFRHRTAHFSSLNEQSGRYSVIENECYKPRCLRKQSKKNKQGSGEDLPDVTNKLFPKLLHNRKNTFDLYNEMLENGVSRELARIDLPISTYTQFFWKCDLNNIFHLLKLRLDDHSQYEIQVYAKAVALFVKEVCPISFEAFEDFILYSTRLNLEEIHYLTRNKNNLSQKEVEKLNQKILIKKIDYCDGVDVINE